MEASPGSYERSASRFFSLLNKSAGSVRIYKALKIFNDMILSIPASFRWIVTFIELLQFTSLAYSAFVRKVICNFSL